MRVDDYLIDNNFFDTYSDARNALRAGELSLNGFKLGMNSTIPDNNFHASLPIVRIKKSDSVTKHDIKMLETSVPVDTWESDNQNKHVATALENLASKIREDEEMSTFLGLNGTINFDEGAVLLNAYFDSK